MKPPAHRIDTIPPYLFAEIDQKKAAAIARGVDLIDLSIGDPDLPAPKAIIKKLTTAAADNALQKYPPYDGTVKFREAVATWYGRRFGVNLDPTSEVLALIGSKEGIAHLFFAYIDPGDIALLPDPSYPVYKTATLLAGGTPHTFPLIASRKFLPDFSAIDAAVAKKAKLLFINYPGNPTGAVAEKKDLEEAVAFAKEYDLLLCSDLAYSEIAFDGFRPSSVLEIKGAKERTIEFHSLSKTYNVTGFRIGMAVGSAEAIKALRIIKTNIDSGAFMAIQEAGAAALLGSQAHLPKLNAMYARRRNILVAGLNSLGWNIERPKATFYVWAPTPNGMDATDFTTLLLEKCGVAVVPGVGYGKEGEGYFRCAITTDKLRIAQAIARMKKAAIKFS